MICPSNIYREILYFPIFQLMYVYYYSKTKRVNMFLLDRTKDSCVPWTDKDLTVPVYIVQQCSSKILLSLSFKANFFFQEEPQGWKVQECRAWAVHAAVQLRKLWNGRLWIVARTVQVPVPYTFLAILLLCLPNTSFVIKCVHLHFFTIQAHSIPLQWHSLILQSYSSALRSYSIFLQSNSLIL